MAFSTLPFIQSLNYKRVQLLVRAVLWIEYKLNRNESIRLYQR